MKHKQGRVFKLTFKVKGIYLGKNLKKEMIRLAGRTKRVSFFGEQVDVFCTGLLMGRI